MIQLVCLPKVISLRTLPQNVCAKNCQKKIYFKFSLKGQTNHHMSDHQPGYLNNYNNNDEIKNNFVQDCENFKFPNLLQDHYSDPMSPDEEIQPTVTSTNRRRLVYFFYKYTTTVKPNLKTTSE